MDNSLTAILVLAMIVWEFIQHLTAEKSSRRGSAQRGTAFKNVKNNQLKPDDHAPRH
jgi:hypothetical protein